MQTWLKQTQACMQYISCICYPPSCYQLLKPIRPYVCVPSQTWFEDRQYALQMAAMMGMHIHMYMTR